MITVTIEFPLKPGKLAEFQRIMAAAIKDTASKPGFRWLHIHRPLKGEDSALLIEQWDSAEAYKAYTDWRAAGNSVDGIAECLAGPPKTSRWGEVIASE